MLLHDDEAEVELRRALIDLRDVRRQELLRLGFQRGDVIQEVNGARIGKTKELEAAAKTPNGAWRIVVIRRGQKISAVFGG